MATGGVASHHLAGVLHGLDSVRLDGHLGHRAPHRERAAGPRLPAGLAAERIVTVGGLPCTDGMQTLRDLAPSLSDLVWEQALESALRKRLTSVDASTRCGPCGSARVLALRPPGAPPTESLLETLMVQLTRTVPGPARARAAAV